MKPQVLNTSGMELLTATANKCIGQMAYFLNGSDLWQQSEIQGLYDATRTLAATLEMMRNYEHDQRIWSTHVVQAVSTQGVW